MNRNAKEYRVRPCVVCGYSYSDKHHVFAERCKPHRSPTIILCPNHHRYAHIFECNLQNTSRWWAEKFAHKNFDKDFIKIMVSLLLYLDSELKSVERKSESIKNKKDLEEDKDWAIMEFRRDLPYFIRILRSAKYEEVEAYHFNLFLTYSPQAFSQ